MWYIARVPKPCIMALQKRMLHFLPPGGGKTVVMREAHFEVKMYKAHQVRTTFGS